MKVRVHFAAQLRTAIGRSEEEIELTEGNTVAALVEQLAKRFDVAAAHLTTRAGGIPAGLLVVINESAVGYGQMAATVLRAGDVVTLLPPIAGG